MEGGGNSVVWSLQSMVWVQGSGISPWNSEIIRLVEDLPLGRLRGHARETALIGPVQGREIQRRGWAGDACRRDRERCRLHRVAVIDGRAQFLLAMLLLASA